MSRQDILKFIEEFHSREGKPPSIRVIAKNIDDVSKTSFYDYFPEGINEALNLLGFEGTVEGPTKALEARKAKSDSGYRITLNEAQTRKLLGIAFLEGEEPSMVIDDILRDQRGLREVLALLDQNVLNEDIIRAILNPTYFYRGINISGFSHKPWLMLPCTSCRKPVVFSEASDSAQWRSLTAGIKEFFPVVTHNRCGLKMPRVVRFPVR